MNILRELRVGSLIASTNSEHRGALPVNGIIPPNQSKDYWSVIVTLGDMSVREFNISDIAPFSITEDDLGLFGFERVKPRKGVCSAYKNGSIRINVSNSGNLYHKGTLVISAHQLQNIIMGQSGTCENSW